LQWKKRKAGELQRETQDFFAEKNAQKSLLTPLFPITNMSKLELKGKLYITSKFLFVFLCSFCVFRRRVSTEGAFSRPLFSAVPHAILHPFESLTTDFFSLAHFDV